MKEIDLHGYLVLEAEQVFFSYLNKARLESKCIEVCFITGVGKIQKRFQVLAKQEDVYWYIPMQNRGCIVIEFE